MLAQILCKIELSTKVPPFQAPWATISSTDALDIQIFLPCIDKYVIRISDNIVNFIELQVAGNGVQGAFARGDNYMQ